MIEWFGFPVAVAIVGAAMCVAVSCSYDKVFVYSKNLILIT